MSWKKYTNSNKASKNRILGSKYGFNLLSNDEDERPTNVLNKTTKGIIQIFYGFRYFMNWIVDNPDSLVSRIYNILIGIVALLSVIPLFLIEENVTNNFLLWIANHNEVFILIFIIDYTLRWFLADFKIKRGWASFIMYPFTVWAVIDLIGILPFFLKNQTFRILSTFRLFKIVRIFPKLAEGFSTIIYSIATKWRIFVVIFITLLFFVVIGGLIIFQIEYGQPDSQINNYGDAVWFVFITITTIGYGDISPATSAGRAFTTMFAMIGIAIISIVTAIFASGFADLDRLESEMKSEQVFDDQNVLVWHQSNVDLDLSLKLKEEKKQNPKITEALHLEEEIDINIEEQILFVFENDEDDNVVEKFIKFKK